MRHLLLTGFPGFLSRMLVRRIAADFESITLLVEARMEAEARAEAERIATVTFVPRERFEVVVGDITRSELGLDPVVAARLRGEVDTVLHLAAIYDLAVGAAVAERINVRGTRNVNLFALSLDRLERYGYVSTFAVAGRRIGLVRERDLEHDAGFHNHYEETKYRAEVAVRRLQEAGHPVAVFRPGVVVGSSRDGRTVKYDGPYMLLEALRRLPWPLDHLNLGDPGFQAQVVPVDFVIDAIATILPQAAAAGATFHLTDPDPRTTAEIFDLFCTELTGSPSVARVPSVATRVVTESGLSELLGLQRQAGPYFFHRARFDCLNTLDALDGTGIACPPLESYVGQLVRYWRTHARPAA